MLDFEGEGFDEESVDEMEVDSGIKEPDSELEDENDIENHPPIDLLAAFPPIGFYFLERIVFFALFSFIIIVTNLLDVCFTFHFPYFQHVNYSSSF